PIRRKLTTARAVYRAAGVPGIARELRGRAPLRWASRRYWLEEDHWWLGRLVELAGDRVRIGGCTFRVDAPGTPTAMKSLFLFGRYGAAEREALRRVLDPDLPLVELGASIGVLACLGNAMLRDPTRHVVVEANPDLIPLLEANRRRNGARFRIRHAALAYGAPTATFHTDDFLSSSLAGGRGRAVAVPAVTLEAVLDEAGFATATLLCDVEGAEVALARHELDVLRRRIACLIVETHPARVGRPATRALERALGAAGFEAVFRRGDTTAWRRRAGAPEPA